MKNEKNNLSRLDFLKQSGLALGGIGLGVLGGSSVLSSCNRKRKIIPFDLPKDKVRLGIIGTGQRFQEQIILGLKYLPNFDVIATSDLIPARLEGGLKYASPKAKGYKDYRELLDRKDLDAVVVCTQLNSHFQIAKDVIDAGIKNVTCEKTMTYNIEQAIELEKTVKANNTQFRVSHEHRKNPSVNKMKEMIEQGVIGQVTHIDTRWDSYTDWRREVVDPNFAELINWRMYKKYCGGLMTEIVTHLVDAVNYLLDSHPIKAYSSGSIAYWKDGRDTWDNVEAIYDYPNGVKVTAGANKASQFEGGYWKIYGTKATLELRMGFHHTLTITPNHKLEGAGELLDGVSGASMKIIKDKDKKSVLVDDELYASYNDQMYTFYADTLFGYKHFLDMIVNGAPTDISVTDGKLTAISAHMANLSNRNNTIEEWKPEYGG
ncbi:MAG: Gfo/Idh/MocA family oxidoreductase [Bacteroidota bacterium]